MKILCCSVIFSAFALFLLACSGSGQETETFSEGVDTVCEITSYHTCPDADRFFLQEGDQVAVISPSSLPSLKQRDALMKGLRELGYVPVEGACTVKEDRTLEEIAADLKWALETPEIKGIFCIRGGTASSEVLDFTGLEVIAANPKPIIGFSDISTFLSAWTVSGIPSIHSATMSSETLSRECAEVRNRMLKGELPSYRCQGSSFDHQGTAEGILLGGNLSVLLSTLSTDYDPTSIHEPFILFLEETSEDMERIHRYLTILKHLGILDRAQGIIFGEWTDIPSECETYNGNSRGGRFRSVRDMIDRQFLKDLDIPVAFGFPAGHSSTNYPLLFGVKATLRVGADSYTLEWE